MATNLGKVMITPEGKWIIGKLYKRLSAVTHNENLYLSLKDTSVEPSDDGENWMLLLEGVPIAAEDTLGKVKPDGETITIDTDGTIHGASQVPPGVTYIDTSAGSEIQTEVQVIELEGTRVDTLWTTVESGKLDDGTKYEKRQRTAPRTLEKAIQDENGTLLPTKLTDMQTQLDGVSTEIGTTIDEAITKRAGEDIATKEDLTALKFQGNKLTTEDEINTFYDTYSDKYGNDTWYRTILNHGFWHSILGGGRCYLEGYKATDKYEWQKITSYLDNTGKVRCFVRAKENGTWTEWQKISDGGNADTLDGKHASDFLPLTGGTLTGDCVGVTALDGSSKAYLHAVDSWALIRNILPDNSIQDLGIKNEKVYFNVYGADGVNKFGAEILHTGISAPVKIDSTAPTDTSALWYNPSTKTLKSYVDGAWT